MKIVCLKELLNMTEKRYNKKLEAATRQIQTSYSSSKTSNILLCFPSFNLSKSIVVVVV